MNNAAAPAEALCAALEDAARSLLDTADLPRPSNDQRPLSAQERARLRATAVLQNAFVLTDPALPDNPVVYANAAFFELSGYPKSEIIGFNCLFLQERKAGKQWRKAGGNPRHAVTRGDAEMEADQVRRSAQGAVAGFSMLNALVTAVDNKDRYTRKHSEGVLGYSLMIARELGLDDETQNTLTVAALLHDVGKIGVPDAILRKPGKLTNEEFEAIQQHPTMGAALVSTVPGLEATLGAVRHHHERWDGAGYPDGLRGAETPLIARLMAVADAFSAMTTDRPYRQGMDREKALSILSAGAGTQWDPACLEAFLRSLGNTERFSSQRANWTV